MSKHQEIISQLDDFISKLRKLEKAASLNPGIEEDHDHSPSREYEAYDNGWYELEGFLNDLPQPVAWIEFYDWCDNNNNLFGDISMPGGNRAKCI